MHPAVCKRAFGNRSVFRAPIWELKNNHWSPKALESDPKERQSDPKTTQIAPGGPFATHGIVKALRPVPPIRISFSQGLDVIGELE